MNNDNGATRKPIRRRYREMAVQFIVIAVVLSCSGAQAQTSLNWDKSYLGVIPPRVNSHPSYAAAVQAGLDETNAVLCDVQALAVPGSAYYAYGPKPLKYLSGSGTWYSRGVVGCIDRYNGAGIYGRSYRFTAPDCIGDGSEPPPCGQQSALSPPPGDCGPPPSNTKIDNPTNPCDPSSGNKSQAEIDYSSGAIGGLEFTRYYNSSGPYKTGPNMQAGWRHTYSRAINEEPDRRATLTFSIPSGQSTNYATASDACSSGWDDIKSIAWSGDLSNASAIFVGGNTCRISSGGSTVAYFPVRQKTGWGGFTPATTIRAVTRPHGARHIFEFDGVNWVNHLNSVVTLEPSGSDWVFTDGKDTRETYSSSGQLMTITYRNGRSETLEYDLTSGQGGDDDPTTLDKVTGPFGHTLTFAYDVNGILAAVNTPDGAIQYVGDGNDNLSTVTYPDTATRQYLYENTGLRNHLTGITDENGDRYATWAYDYTGRAISSEHAGGKERVTLAYNADGTADLTMANGAKRTYSYSTEKGQRRLTSLSGDVCSTCTRGNVKSRSYNSNGHVAEVTDWNDNVTRTERNVRGLTETLTEAVGTSEQRVTTRLWHANFRLPTQVTTPRNVTDYAYDTNGNVASISVAGVGASRSWAFIYNTESQLVSVDGPRTGVSDITTLEYYACTTGSECGQLKKVTNALGHVTTYDNYDAAGRLIQLTEPNGRQTSLTYDNRGRVLTSTQTPLLGTPRVSTMAYDGVGQLTTQSLPDGSTLTYSYDAAHYLTSVTDNLGNSTSYDYDAMGNPTDEDTYDPGAILKRTLDYAYDINERIETVTDGGFGTDLTFDLVGNLTDSTDPNGNATQQTYDALDRLDSTIDAMSGVVDYDYDAHDNLTQIAAANGATTTYLYDGLDNLVSETSPDRGLTAYTYDSAGNRLTATDARGVTSSYVYDALDRLTSVSYPDASENVTYAYDDVASSGIGRLTSVNDQSGSTAYSYDVYGAVATVSQQVSGITYAVSYQYDAAGRVSSITYPSGRTVDYGRDSIGQITQIDSSKNGVPKNIVTNTSYEPFGPITELSYGNGLDFDFDYRTDYRTERISSTGIADISYGYDPAGNIVTVDDALDASLRRDFGFDALDRVNSESFLGTYSGFVLADRPLAYWRLGEDSGSTAVDASGNGHDLAYSGPVILGQPELVAGSSDTAVRIDPYGSAYAIGSPLTGKVLTGLEVWFEGESTGSPYDNIVTLHNKNSDRILVKHNVDGTVSIYRNNGDVLTSDGTWTKNAPHHVVIWYEAGPDTTYMMIDGVVQQNTYAGNLLGVSNPKVILGAHQTGSSIYKRFTGTIDEVAIYDEPVYSGTFADHTANAGSGSTWTKDFTYDANGNRTSLDDGSTVTTYSYAPQSNRLTLIDTASLQLDPAGNRIADANGTRTYTYNGAGRLNAVLDNGVQTASYVHNALGQRTQKTVGGISTVYLYDLNGQLIAEHDGTGTWSRDYVWLNGQPVAQVDAGEVFSYLHVDHLGTPRLATDDAQTVVWRWDSDAFGATLADGDPDGDGAVVTVNLRFPGQYYDVESGLHYNYFRTYDPSTGRYLESDPIGLGGGLNTYGYVAQNPLRYTDPTGKAIPIVIACAANPVACGALVVATGVAVYNFGQDVADIIRDRPRAQTPPPTSLPFPIPMEGVQSNKDKCIDKCYPILEQLGISSDIRTNLFNKCINKCMEELENCE